jgi:YXWGXW repeat-containing protein
MNRHLKRAVLIALGLAVVLSLLPAGAAAEPRIYVRVAPPHPPAAVVVRPARPSERHVWVDGFHRWDGHAYVWVPGEWREGPRHGARWVPGHWKNSRHGWYWVDGHWR